MKIRTSLLSEWHVTSILSKRESLSRGGLKLETTNTQIATLVLRAEPTVASILKTLDTDYAKNQVIKANLDNYVEKVITSSF